MQWKYVKNPKEKTMERSFTMSMAITIRFSRFGLMWSLSRWKKSSIYKSCPINKARESCLVWIPQYRILITIEPDTLVWIDIGESPSLSFSSRSAVDKDELLPRSYYLVWIRIGLKGRDLSVATRHTSVRGWIDMCYDLVRVRKRPLQKSPLLPFSERGWELSLGRFQVPGVFDV